MNNEGYKQIVRQIDRVIYEVKIDQRIELDRQIEEGLNRIWGDKLNYRSADTNIQNTKFIQGFQCRWEGRGEEEKKGGNKGQEEKGKRVKLDNGR